MGCNCKTKKNTEKIIKTVEDINKSTSKNYKTGNKTVLKIAFNTLSVIVYILFGILFILGIIPTFLYMIISGKSITINKPKFMSDGK